MLNPGHDLASALGSRTPGFRLDLPKRGYTWALPFILNIADMLQGISNRPTSLLRLLVGVVLPLLLVGLFATYVWEQKRFAAEVKLLYWVHAHTSSSLVQISLFLNNLGEPGLMAGLFGLMLGALWLGGRQPQARFALLGLGSAVSLAFLMKLLLHRSRPELWPQMVVEHSSSFPSGHSTVAAALATFTVLMLWRSRWRWPAWILGGGYALLMGYSRLVLGVHYPSDVLAGWLIGLSTVLGAYHGLSATLTQTGKVDAGYPAP